MDLHLHRGSDSPENIRRYWFGDLTPSGWADSSSDSADLFRRLNEFGAEMSRLPSWEDGVSSGFCSNKEDYFLSLRNLCLLWSQNVIHSHCSSDEAQLIRLVLILRELDLMINHISEQVGIWDQMMACASGTSSVISADFQDQSQTSISDSECISRLNLDVSRIKESRSRLSKQISIKSQRLLPNCSALVGPLVAARVLAACGGREKLARMPASGIQIIGARNALFSHLTKGSPPPKHGLIFEHKRIHAAPRKVRGKVSRTLAASLALAARIDYYRGSSDPLFLERANGRIDTAGRIR